MCIWTGHVAGCGKNEKLMISKMILRGRRGRRESRARRVKRGTRVRRVIRETRVRRATKAIRAIRETLALRAIRAIRAIRATSGVFGIEPPLLAPLIRLGWSGTGLYVMLRGRFGRKQVLARGLRGAR